MVALITAFVAAVILKYSPLQAIQLLWVNLIMDSLAALALATEEPKPEVLERPPYRRDEYIISGKMVKHILCNSIYQIAIIYSMAFAGEFWIPDSKPSDVPDYPLSDNKYVFPGRPTDWNTEPLYDDDMEKDFGASRHMTMVFNQFVWL